MKKIQEFIVKIHKEKDLFAVDIDFPDGEILTTQGKSINECYERISEILQLRFEGKLNNNLERTK